MLYFIGAINADTKRLIAIFYILRHAFNQHKEDFCDIAGLERSSSNLRISSFSFLGKANQNYVIKYSSDCVGEVFARDISHLTAQEDHEDSEEETRADDTNPQNVRNNTLGPE